MPSRPAAFYADCRHEVLPVTEGYRLTLIFNLVRPNTKTALSPQPVDFRRKINQSALLLKNWTASLAKDSTSKLPNKLIVPLEHAYTDAEIGFYNLKNADAALAKILNQAARKADCEIVLASVNMSQTTKWFVSGSLWGDDDAGHRVAGEWIVREVEEPAHWISVQQTDFWDDSNFPELPYSADEFCPPEAFEQIEACEFEYYEVKGNEAASVERHYNRAALIIWPRAARLSIFHEAGKQAALWELSNLRKLWEREGKPHHSPHRRNAQMAASLILRDWLPDALAQRSWFVNSFADLLLDLEDSEHIDQLWSMIVEKGFYHENDYKQWLKMSKLLPWDTVIQRLESAINIIGRKEPKAAAALLAAFCRSRPDKAPSLKGAAEALYAALPGEPGHLQPTSSEALNLSITPQAVADILESFNAIEPGLVDKALEHMLNWPNCCDIEKILMPAFLQLMNQPVPVVMELRALIKSYLQNRIRDESLHSTDC